jgi:hypothetical protein
VDCRVRPGSVVTKVGLCQGSIFSLSDERDLLYRGLQTMAAKSGTVLPLSFRQTVLVYRDCVGDGSPYLFELCGFRLQYLFHWFCGLVLGTEEEAAK